MFATHAVLDSEGLLTHGNGLGVAQAQHFLLVFCQDDASIAGSGVLKASAITVLSSISPFR